MKKIFATFILTLICLTGFADRPKVGLVLAGGGAKGSAHIGVLKYLEEQGIPIDYIAGTSMGSIVGGLYALGYSPAQLDSIIKAVDWSYYMSNQSNRRNKSFSLRNNQDLYSINIPFGIKEQKRANDYITNANAEELRKRGELVNEKTGSAFSRSLASGLVNGNHLENLFNDLCVGYQDSINFDKLPIPYACVATDLLGGKEFVIRNGRLPFAMRSSMAIPIFFSPVEYQGRLLVDGGMVNNFPTDVCREMGADIIIGVELNEGFRADKKDINSMPGLLGQLFKIVTSGRNADNRKLCDVYIRPNVDGYGMMSFDARSVDSLVERGYIAAKQFDKEIKKIKSREGNAVKTLQSKPARTLSSKPITLRVIDVNGLTDSEAKWFNRKWNLTVGKTITPEDLHSTIDKYKGTGIFSSIDYFIKDTLNGQAIKLVFKKRPENSFHMGLWADTEEAVAVGINLGFRDNSFAGLKGNVNMRLSYNPYAVGTLTYSIPGVFSLNLGGSIRYSRFGMTQTDAEINSKLLTTRANFYIQNYYSRHSVFNTGVTFEWNKENDMVMAALSFGEKDKDRKAFAFSYYELDTRDHYWKPTKGWKLRVSGRYRFWTDYVNYFTEKKPDPMASILATAEWNFSPGKGKFTFIPQVYFRHLFKDNWMPDEYNQTGGWEYGRYTDIHLPFIGINGVEMPSGMYLAIPRMDIRWNINSVHSLTAVCNGLFAEGRNNIGAALKYTFGTPIGPLSFDVHWSDFGRFSNWGIGLAFGCYF